jgi:hypothetical protein
MDWIGRVIENKETVLRYMWIPQLLTGAVLLVTAYYMGHVHLHLLRQGAQAPGRVVGHEQKMFVRSGARSGHTTTAYMPVVEFNVMSRAVRFTDWLGAPSAGSLPDRVTVRYDPANPSIAMIDRPVMNWIPWAPIAAVGGFLTIVGISGWGKRHRP